jgi:hypothetical protein
VALIQLGVRMRTIEDLRRFAELNLCKDCFQKYTMLIEGTIKNWLSQPISDWRQAESYVTQMVMKTKGVFKGKTIIISLDEGDEEKCADEVDVKAFGEIKKWTFKWKIDFGTANRKRSKSNVTNKNDIRIIKQNLLFIIEESKRIVGEKLDLLAKKEFLELIYLAFLFRIF